MSITQDSNVGEVIEEEVIEGDEVIPEEVNEEHDDTPTEEKDEKLSTEDESVDVNELINGWKEDRDRIAKLEEENFNLKNSVVKPKKTDLDDDDEVSFDERVESEIKRREELNQSIQERNKQSAEREVQFMERTNPLFRSHKKEIIKIAVDKGKNLYEAFEEFSLLKKVAEAEMKKENDKRKKVVSQNNSGNSSGGKITYDKKSDSKKSIRQLFMEGL